MNTKTDPVRAVMKNVVFIRHISNFIILLQLPKTGPILWAKFPATATGPSLLLPFCFLLKLTDPLAKYRGSIERNGVSRELCFVSKYSVNTLTDMKIKYTFRRAFEFVAFASECFVLYKFSPRFCIAQCGLVDDGYNTDT
jgi:hypothetical protein